jgi:2-succinyl-5-enolpyruvyl-6-hydroxy-3-cyclohexene-1-carboxylate synthase
MPAENAGRAFALVLVDELVRRGMRHAVVAPGSRSTPIALALLENPDVEVHVRIDERSAAYLALGIAKATGAVVPVLCTSGTAASYFHGAVMEADQSRVPLLVLTADRPPELHGIGANQTVEQGGLYGEAVRWAPPVGVAESNPNSVQSWRDLAGEAIGHCLGRRGAPPGPVHLNLPLREPLTPVDDGVGFPYDLGAVADQPTDGVGPAEPDTGERILADLLRTVRRGVIVAGGGADTDAVARFAAHGWPVIAEPHSNCRRGAALRATDALLRDSAFTSEHRPELVVVVGRVGLSRTLLAWLEATPHIVVSLDGGRWDVTRTARSVVHCTPAELAAVAAPLAPEWAQEWQAAARQAGSAIDALLDDGDRLTEPRVVRDVADLLPADSALVVASSMPIRDLDLVMRPRDDITVYANRGVSGIDGFVSTAQGIALSGTHSGPTVAITGDLSLLHDINGLTPAPGRQADVTYVVINNDGGGIFSLLPQANAIDPAAFEQLFGTPHGVDFATLATAYDVAHTLVSTAAELAASLAAYGGIRMIEIRTDRAENAALHARMRATKP